MPPSPQRTPPKASMSVPAAATLRPVIKGSSASSGGISIHVCAIASRIHPRWPK